MKTLKELFVSKPEDRCGLEHRTIKVLPDAIKAATCANLTDLSVPKNQEAFELAEAGASTGGQ